MGLVNSAQTYCGLEIAIMHTTPMASWVQREALSRGTGAASAPGIEACDEIEGSNSDP